MTFLATDRLPDSAERDCGLRGELLKRLALEAVLANPNRGERGRD